MMSKCDPATRTQSAPYILVAAYFGKRFGGLSRRTSAVTQFVPPLTPTTVPSSPRRDLYEYSSLSWTRAPTSMVATATIWAYLCCFDLSASASDLSCISWDCLYAPSLMAATTCSNEGCSATVMGAGIMRCGLVLLPVTGRLHQG